MTRSLVAGSRWNWTRRSFRSQARAAAIWAGGASMIAGLVAVYSVKNINEMQVSTAHWIRENTAQSDLVAVNDIGAIGFLSERRVIDTVGLVEPAITEHFLDGGKLAAYLAERRPRYVVVFPDWYPEFTSMERGLDRRTAFTTTPNVVCGGDELVVYEPDWQRLVVASDRRSGNGSGADAGVGHAQSLP